MPIPYRDKQSHDYLETIRENEIGLKSVNTVKG